MPRHLVMHKFAHEHVCLDLQHQCSTNAAAQQQRCKGLCYAFTALCTAKPHALCHFAGLTSGVELALGG